MVFAAFSPLVCASPLLGVGHPAWQYDPTGNLVNVKALVDKFAATGAQVWRESMYFGNSPSPYYSTLKSYLDGKGAYFVIQTLVQGWPNVEQESDIINGVGHWQTSWIDYWSGIISVYHPYGIMVMNEPSKNGVFTSPSAEEFALYRQFCINSINAWRAVDPDIVILVQNYPFTDAFDSYGFGFAYNPLPFSGLFYSRHIYYAFDNTYPPWYLPSQQKYWNATNDQEIAEAKSSLTNFISTESLPMLNIGQHVIYDEMGANILAPNAAAYVRDFIRICVSLNVSVLYYNMAPWGYGIGREPTGILDDTYKNFNGIGETWASEVSAVLPTPTLTPTPTLPPTPTLVPTLSPSVSPRPTANPTLSPTILPTPSTSMPTMSPTYTPTSTPAINTPTSSLPNSTSNLTNASNMTPGLPYYLDSAIPSLRVRSDDLVRISVVCGMVLVIGISKIKNSGLITRKKLKS
jgi:hypothetical protein